MLIMSCCDELNYSHPYHRLWGFCIPQNWSREGICDVDRSFVLVLWNFHKPSVVLYFNRLNSGEMTYHCSTVIDY